MEIVSVTKGTGPLILSMPHGGTHIPEALRARFNNLGCAVPDTDWWMDQLYNFGTDLNATVVKANLSRFVVDLNRDPSGQSLYPGQTTTGLCPTEVFDGKAIYNEGEEPDEVEIEDRRGTYFAPYHHALDAAIADAKAAHGYALLYDCHSIRSQVPRLFEGDLPNVNLGTHDGQSCAPGMQVAITDVCQAQGGFSFVANGRFKGGWITRNYGQPARQVHAVQVELTQCSYMMETPPWTFDEEKAEQLRGLLRPMLEAMTGWATANLRAIA